MVFHQGCTQSKKKIPQLAIRNSQFLKKIRKRNPQLAILILKSANAIRNSQLQKTPQFTQSATRNPQLRAALVQTLSGLIKFLEFFSNKYCE